MPQCYGGIKLGDFFVRSYSAAVIIQISGHLNRWKNTFTHFVHFQQVDKRYLFIVF
jgi:hypothetical protein